MRALRRPGSPGEGAGPWWLPYVARDVTALLGYRSSAPSGARAHPTDEHLLPLYVALGAAGPRFEAERIHCGIDDYVLAMDAFAFSSPVAAQLRTH